MAGLAASLSHGELLKIQVRGPLLEITESVILGVEGRFWKSEIFKSSLVIPWDSLV